MSKGMIATFYIIGILTAIIATIAFFSRLNAYNSAAASYVSKVNSCVNDSPTHTQYGDVSPSTILQDCKDEASIDLDNMSYAHDQMIAALVFMALAGIPTSIAWIGTLVNLSRMQAWTRFVLTFFFGGIMVFIYLVGDPSSPQAKSYSPAGQGTPSNASFEANPQAYQPQPPQTLSPLEILQQRYARGEIDTPTFQQMRALLEETPPRPTLYQ